MDSLDDDLAGLILSMAARRDWWCKPCCGMLSPLEGRNDTWDAEPERLIDFRPVCSRFKTIVAGNRVWTRIALSNWTDVQVKWLVSHSIFNSKKPPTVERIAILGGCISASGYLALFRRFRNALKELHIACNDDDNVIAASEAMAAIGHFPVLKNVTLGLSSHYRNPGHLAMPNDTCELNTNSCFSRLRNLEVRCCSFVSSSVDHV